MVRLAIDQARSPADGGLVPLGVLASRSIWLVRMFGRAAWSPPAVMPVVWSWLVLWDAKAPLAAGGDQ